jgi:HlyD family secretion protein
VVVGDISRERIRAEIDETDVGRISLGQAAYAIADAYKGQRFTGKISKIAARMGKKAVYRTILRKSETQRCWKR